MLCVVSSSYVEDIARILYGPPLSQNRQKAKMGENRRRNCGKTTASILDWSRIGRHSRRVINKRRVSRGWHGPRSLETLGKLKLYCKIGKLCKVDKRRRNGWRWRGELFECATQANGERKADETEKIHIESEFCTVKRNIHEHCSPVDITHKCIYVLLRYCLTI